MHPVKVIAIWALGTVVTLVVIGIYKGFLDFHGKRDPLDLDGSSIMMVSVLWPIILAALVVLAVVLLPHGIGWAVAWLFSGKKKRR